MKLKTVLELASQHKVSQYTIRKFARDNNINAIKIVKRSSCYNPIHFDEVGLNVRYIEKVVYITENFFIFESKMNLIL